MTSANIDPAARPSTAAIDGCPCAPSAADRAMSRRALPAAIDRRMSPES